MKFGVVPMRADQKVRGRVVGLVAIDVVHNFGLWVAAPKVAERATEHALSDHDVFVLAHAFRDSDTHIAVAGYLSVADGRC